MKNNNKNNRVLTNSDFGIHESQLSDEEAKEKGLVRFGKYLVNRKEKRVFIYIRILSILVIFVAIGGIRLAFVYAFRAFKDGMMLSPIAIATFFAYLIVGVIYFKIASGLWKFRRWARTVLLILSTLSIIYTTANLYLEHEPYWEAITLPLIPLFILLIVIVVLTNKTANKIFKASFPTLKLLSIILVSFYIGACIIFFSFFSIKPKNYQIIFKVREEAIEKAAVIDMMQLKNSIERRCKALGLPFWMREIKIKDADKICLGLHRPEEINLEVLKRIITTKYKLELKRVEKGPAPNKEILLKEYDGKIPDQMELIKEGYPHRNHYLVRKVAVLTGKDLKSARLTVDELNNPAVIFDLNSAAAQRFYKFTSENIGHHLGVILDEELYSAPIIEGAISDRVMIRGEFTKEQAEDLVFMLRAGGDPFPYPVKVIYEGPKEDK